MSLVGVGSKPSMPESGWGRPATAAATRVREPRPQGPKGGGAASFASLATICPGSGQDLSMSLEQDVWRAVVDAKEMGRAEASNLRFF